MALVVFIEPRRLLVGSFSLACKSRDAQSSHAGRSFGDGAIFYLVCRAILGNSQDFGYGGWRKNLSGVVERFLRKKQGQLRLPDHWCDEIGQRLFRHEQSKTPSVAQYSRAAPSANDPSTSD